MTHLDAIQKVEDALTALGLMDCYGEPVVGVLAVAPVARHFGAAWDALEDRFESGELAPEQYAKSICALISAYDQFLFDRRVSRRIEDLILDQRELA